MDVKSQSEVQRTLENVSKVKSLAHLKVAGVM